MKVKFSAALAAVLLTIVGCGSGDKAPESTTSGTAATTGKTDAPTGEKKKIAFVTNNVSDFWTIARKGVEKAGTELPNYQIEFQMPAEGTAADQKRIIDDLLSKGIKGIAISPVDPKNQTEELNSVADKAVLFTQDSDAPDSKRSCYLGTDNVAAGKMAAEEVKKALPNGGKIMVFVGKSDAQNAKERYQGLQEGLKGSKVTIIDLRTDDADHAKAKSNVSDTLVKYADVAGLVGLWSYNGPAIRNAVKEANKVGAVKIVAFDEEDETLDGIRDGSISATIVQQPYEFGYQSMKLLAKVLDGDKSGIPAEKKIIVPTRAIDKTSVDEFAKKLKELKGK